MMKTNLILKATNLIKAYPEPRFGQAIMICLQEAYPELYKKITNTELDVFYTTDFKKIQKLLTYIAEENNEKY